MNKNRFYDLVKILLENTEDDVPPMPSREDMMRDQLAWQLSRYNMPWVKG